MPARTAPSILLDHCIPQPLKREFTAGYTVLHTSELAWQRLPDDQLLRAAEAQFDILMTTDQNMRYQQNLPQYKLAIIVLKAKSNRLESLLPLMPDVLNRLPLIKPGELVEIG